MFHTQEVAPVPSASATVSASTSMRNCPAVYDAAGSVGRASREDAAFAERLEQAIYKAEVVSTRFDGSTAAVVVRVDKEALSRILGMEFR